MSYLKSFLRVSTKSCCPEFALVTAYRAFTSVHTVSKSRNLFRPSPSPACYTLRRGLAMDLLQESDYTDDDEGEVQYENDMNEFGEIADAGGTDPWQGHKRVRLQYK